MARAVALAGIVLAALTQISAQARAQQARGGPPPAPCVWVDIAGDKAGQLDCAARALQSAGRLAQAQARSAIDMPTVDAGSPDPTVGISNLAGARLRMGDALGVSVHPQRPGRSPSPPRPGAAVR